MSRRYPYLAIVVSAAVALTAPEGWSAVTADDTRTIVIGNRIPLSQRIPERPGRSNLEKAVGVGLHIIGNLQKSGGSIQYPGGRWPSYGSKLNSNDSRYHPWPKRRDDYPSFDRHPISYKDSPRPIVQIRPTYDYEPSDVYKRPAEEQVTMPAPKNLPPVASTPAPKQIVPARPPRWPYVNDRPQTRFGGNLNFKLADRPRMNLIERLVEKQAEGEIKKLESLNTTSDPVVQALIEQLNDDLHAGNPIDPGFAAKVEEALRAAGASPGELATAAQCAKLLPGIFEVNASIKLATQMLVNTGGNKPNGGFIVPSGAIVWIAVPQLSLGEFYVLPNGQVVAGTGGGGTMQIVAADPAKTLGVPLGVGMATDDAEASEARLLTTGILLRNPAENGGTVRYLADAHWSATLHPGRVRHFERDSQRIRFSRGAGGGEVSYDLEPGSYAFTLGDSGWDLYRESFSVTIDNSRNPSDFHYVVDNHPIRVRAGRSQTHSSHYPIIVRFDRGDGSESTKRIDQSQLLVEVGVDPQEGLWDLFRNDSFAVAGGTSFDSGRQSNTAKAKKTNMPLLIASAKTLPARPAVAAKSRTQLPATVSDAAAVDPAVTKVAGSWSAVAKNSRGELTTVQLHLDNRGWAKLTTTGIDGKPTVAQRRASLEKDELKLTDAESQVSIGKVLEVNDRQMVIERGDSTVTFVRML